MSSGRIGVGFIVVNTKVIEKDFQIRGSEKTLRVFSIPLDSLLMNELLRQADFSEGEFVEVIVKKKGANPLAFFGIAGKQVELDEK